MACFAEIVNWAPHVSFLTRRLTPAGHEHLRAHMLLFLPHPIALGLGALSIAFAICALIGTIYALGFAIVGIGAGKDHSDRSLRVAEGAVEGPAVLQQSTHFLVCIPAHNESSGLIATVAGVLAQNYPQDRIRCLVIADNCTDDTAKIAAEAGAHVLVRTDKIHRGKGHALAWAFAAAQDLPWDAICVIDADSVVAPGFFRVLDESMRRGHPVAQARYDFVHASDSRNWLQQFTAVSKAAENSFVYRSRERMSLLQLLQGNGFCLSRATLQQVPWQAHSIVEDAEYALELGKQGIAVHYQERARIWSRQASTVRDVQPQRVRWASGTWQLFRRGIPALLATAWRRKSLGALEGVVMLLTTSRLLLIYLLGFSLVFSAGATPLFFSFIWRLLLTVVILQSVYLVLMFRFASDYPAPLVGLLHLPFYVAVVASSQVLALVGFNRRVWWRTAR